MSEEFEETEEERRKRREELAEREPGFISEHAIPKPEKDRLRRIGRGVRRVGERAAEYYRTRHERREERERRRRERLEKERARLRGEIGQMKEVVELQRLRQQAAELRRATRSRPSGLFGGLARVGGAGQRMLGTAPARPTQPTPSPIRLFAPAPAAEPRSKYVRKGKTAYKEKIQPRATQPRPIIGLGLGAPKKPVIGLGSLPEKAPVIGLESAPKRAPIISLWGPQKKKRR